MGQQLSGIVTSFAYSGERPSAVLVGNYQFIPIRPRYEPGFKETVLAPYRQLTKPARTELSELSFKGACAYLEIDFHGGLGSQLGEVWQDGDRVTGPLVSLHGYSEPLASEYAANYEGADRVEWAANKCLSGIGIYRRDGMDEFDAAGFGFFDSNDDALNNGASGD